MKEICTICELPTDDPALRLRCKGCERETIVCQSCVKQISESLGEGGFAVWLDSWHAWHNKHVTPESRKKP